MKSFLIAALFVGSFLLTSLPARADDAASGTAGTPIVNSGIPTLVNPLGTTSVPQLLGRVINAFLGITGSLALLLFIYGGFLWLTSGGNEDSIKKGKATIVWAVLGLVIIFGAYALVNFVISRALGLQT